MSAVVRASSRLAGAASLAVPGPNVAVGSLPALGAGGAGGGAPVTVVNVNVAGSVLSDNDLRDVVQQQMLRFGLNNSQTWQAYGRH